jgi:dienelactone hydrolase
MSEGTPQNEIVTKKVVYDMPDTDAVTIRRDVEFRAPDGGVLVMDIYHPPATRARTRTPLVVIVAGYPDAGFQRIVGCRFKDMGSTTSWARLIAASGMAAIAYANRAPVADLHAMLDHVRQNAAALEVDESRIGMWASSGNVPLALSLLMADAPPTVACAALFYGCMLDLDGATGIADAARAFGFVNPSAGKSVDDLRADVPLFLARAGKDQMPGLNDAIDRFLPKAVAANLPLTFVNHPSGPHAFDLFDDSETSREIVRRALSFLRFHLQPAI